LKPQDKVVLKVGLQKFTKADIDYVVEHFLDPRSQRAMEIQGKKDFGDHYAMLVALSHQAHILHLDQTPEFTRKLALQKQQAEAQAAFEEINKQATVTPQEVGEYYMEHSADYEQITLRQIIVRKKAPTPPAAPGSAAPPATNPGLPPEEAKARAEAIHKELVAGTDIQKIMDEFKAPGDVIIDAEPRKVNRSGLPPEIAKVAFALKDGEVSELQDLPHMVVIFQVIKHINPDPKEVTPEIERTLHQKKVDAAIAEVKMKAAVWMDEQYFGPPSRPAPAPIMAAPAPAPAPGAPAVKTPPQP
jgi:parvulin-like peptidyl-prolyl isomerase